MIKGTQGAEKKKSILVKVALPKATKTARSLKDASELPSSLNKTTQSKTEGVKLRNRLNTLSSIPEKPADSNIASQKPPKETKQPEQGQELPPPTQKEKLEKIKLPIYPNITSLKEWKKKHKLEPGVKVYVATGGYGDVRRALDKRGWIENPDPQSLCFDLRWTIKSKEKDIQHLEDYQIVNHFEKNSSITTKAGLCKNLKNLVWSSNVDIDEIYPRCYDLSEEKDYGDFLEQFKFNKAESVLKLYVKLCKEGESQLAKELEETAILALGVCQKKLTDPNEMLEENSEYQPVEITEEEWKVLSRDEISPESLAKRKFEARLAKLEPNAQKKGKSKKRRIIDAKNLQIDKENLNKTETQIPDQSDQKETTNSSTEEVKSEFLLKVEEVLAKLKANDPQFDLLRDKNIWILKPAGLSRGRGITCLKNLVEILDIARKTANQWVVQKYIENPLIIHKRKFDIRQWVLVTDYNPLTIWFYEECYIRFSGDEYNADDLENKFVHLTNNSVVKHSKKEQDDRFEGNMWTMETFQEHLTGEFGKDVFGEIIKPKMKQSVIWSLQSSQDMIGNRKNSFELYGYDFMVDENFNVWLIEINLSPALDYSTAVTKRLVKMVSEDVIKVVVDYGMSKKKGKSKIPTGLFTKIHKSKQCVEKLLNSYGLDLVCEGSPIQKPVVEKNNNKNE